MSLWHNFETEELARTRRALRAVNRIHRAWVWKFALICFLVALVLLVVMSNR